MSYLVSDELIEYIARLSKLELNEQEKENAKNDMKGMLEYIDKMKELDTEDIRPMTHVFQVQNVFREDLVTNSDESDRLLDNAPQVQGNMFVVPKTFE